MAGAAVALGIRAATLAPMNDLTRDDTTTPETIENAPITGEHRLRPPVPLEAEPQETVPTGSLGRRLRVVNASDAHVASPVEAGHHAA